MKKRLLALSGLAAVFLAACNQENISSPEISIPMAEDAHSDLAILSAYFNTTSENIVDKGSHYLVNGEIIVGKDAVSTFGDNNVANTGVAAQKYAYNGTIQNPWLAGNVCFYVPSAVKTAMGSTYNDLVNGVTKWNNLHSQKKAGVKFNLTNTDAEGCVVLRYENTDFCATGASGCADFPHFQRGIGYPSYFSIETRQRLFVIPNEWVNSSSAFREYVIMHGLGLILGFAHTNGTEGYHIGGTPLTEYNSVMDPDRGANTFTNNDILAVQTIYPYNTTPYISSGVMRSGSTFVPMNYLIGAGQVMLLQSVVAFQEQLSPYRLAALTADQRLFVKEGSQAGIWVEVHGQVKSFQIHGTRVGIVTTDGTLKVKDGSLSAAWSVWSGFSRFQMEGTRVAGLKSNGCLVVKEGAVNTAFLSTGEQHCQVQDFHLEGNRIGIVANGAVKVKNGALTALWNTPAIPSEAGSFSEIRINGNNTYVFSNSSTYKGLWWRNGDTAPLTHMSWLVKKYKVDGNRIVVLHLDGTITGKDGMNAEWTALLPTGGAVDLDIRGNRIDAILSDGRVTTKTGLNGTWSNAGFRGVGLNDLPL